jgi:hypothetical protein
MGKYLPLFEEDPFFVPLTSVQNDSRLHFQQKSNPRYALLKYLELEDIGRKLYRNFREYSVLSVERKPHHKTLDYLC